ncbi:MAG: serine hydrolase [Bosea sp. (in: a-proteobacteria)]
MRLFWKLLAFALAPLASALAAGTPVHAQSAGPSLVVDAASGAILHEERSSQAWHPASTTKMMTAYVALRAVRAGRIGLETPIPASALAAKQPRVKVYIKPGQEITLDNALKVMMVKSANDIAYVIAEGVGGNVETFVSMMNAEARRLGLRDTVFRNPNGWHHPEQQTSARDLAILAMTMLREFPEYGDYWGIGAVQLGRVTLNNTNGLIGRYSGASGFKTGFVCASGFNVVATATRGGRTLIAVVLGAYSGAERTVKAAQILDASFSSWGGTGRSVSSLPSSGTQARSICAEVRAFGRGAPLADDADSTGAISFQPQSGNSDSISMYATMAPAQQSTTRTVGGRLTLGPRQQFAPIVVAYGRSSGSDRAPLAANVAARRGTAVAATPAANPQAAPELAAVAPSSPVSRPRTQSANGAIQPSLPSAPVAAGAVAGSAVAGGAVAGGAVAAAAAAFAASRPASGATETPIRLHGAIGQGRNTAGGAAPVELRPSASAGIKPRPAAQLRPQAAALSPPAARPGAAKPQQAKPALAKPQTATARPAAARPAAAKPALVKPATTRPSTPPRRPVQNDD